MFLYKNAVILAPKSLIGTHELQTLRGHLHGRFLNDEEEIIKLPEHYELSLAEANYLAKDLSRKIFPLQAQKVETIVFAQTPPEAFRALLSHWLVSRYTFLYAEKDPTNNWKWKITEQPSEIV